MLLFPKSESPQERVGVVAHAAAWRQFFQFFGIASPKNHVVRFEGSDQAGDHIRDMAAPFALAVLL